ncbi:MAG: adenylate/guanylate cyclase domain-containing protein [Saprospiraceae bacterium]|nr:adenylate/guanylate cyclase domain-containing protein [Saprospiraceae bacterium]
MSVSTRELAAILFADIVGYTTSMQHDEDAALQMVRDYQEILQSAAEAHGGRIYKNYGDGSLLVFPNSAGAVLAAIQIQADCMRDRTIPVRIGMHVGEFVVRDGDLYGNGINLASRIESLGVAGSILMSGDVQRKVKNRPELDLVRVGVYQFKNVDEPVEVFAIKGEGLRVPPRDRTHGLLASGKRGRRSRLWIGLISVVALLAAAWWFVVGKDAPARIAETDRARSIVVSVFDNQTNDPSLDAFGNMISDWTTSSLKETGEANIVNLANLPDSSMVSAINQVNSAAAQAIGIDLILRGRYYLTESQLTIVGDIIDSGNRSTIESFSVTGRRDDLSELLAQFARDVQSYWAVRDLDRFLNNPPDYQAYRHWKAAQPLKYSDPAKSQELLRQAYQRDTNFMAPLFELYAFASNQNDQAAKEEIIAVLASKSDQFTTWESLSFDIIRAMEERNFLLVAQLSERRFAMDQSDHAANSNAASFYGWTNRPGKALEVYNRFDERLLGEETSVLSWRETCNAFSLYLLGRYLEVAEVATSYAYPKMPVALAVIHLKSLVRMDSLHTARVQFEDYRRSGTYNMSGQPSPADDLPVLVCDELYLTGHEQEIEYYVQKLLEVVENDRDSPNNAKLRGLVAFYRQQYAMAAGHWESESTFSSSLPGWMNAGIELEHQSRLGHAYAMAEMPEQADSILLSHFSKRKEEPALLAAQQYYAARILGALGKGDEAVASLNAAIKNGFSFFRPSVFHQDPFLRPLSGHPGFAEILRPKG